MSVPADQTIRLAYQDGWRVEIAPPVDGATQVSVFSPGGRQWSGARPTLEEALDLAWRILDEQRLAHELAREAAAEPVPPIGG